jgi:hypothetical protein
LIQKTCTEDHGEYGDITFEVPEVAEANTFYSAVCAWHTTDADGNMVFDREAYEETLKEETNGRPGGLSVLPPVDS